MFSFPRSIRQTLSSASNRQKGQPSCSVRPSDSRSRAAQVRITVNDEPIPFFMKVGETGEAFFVFETDADLPEDMQTSPLAGPLADVESPGVGLPIPRNFPSDETGQVGLLELRC